MGIYMHSNLKVKKPPRSKRLEEDKFAPQNGQDEKF